MVSKPKSLSFLLFWTLQKNLLNPFLDYHKNFKIWWTIFPCTCLFIIHLVLDHGHVLHENGITIYNFKYDMKNYKDYLLDKQENEWWHELFNVS